MVTNSCLGCGKKGHFARYCPASSSDNFMVHSCGHCNATMRISDQGQQTTETNRGTKRLRDDAAPQPPEPQQQRPKASAPAAPAVPSAGLRLQVPQAAAVQQVAAAPQQRRPACLRVLVCSHEYTSLQWFLGKKPAPRKVAEVLAKCKANVVQLRFGDTKTLEAAGFAKPPPHGKELLPGRQNLPSDWQDTACKAVRGSTKVQLRRPGAPSAARGVLWRVSDLQSVLMKKRCACVCVCVFWCTWMHQYRYGSDHEHHQSPISWQASPSYRNCCICLHHHPAGSDPLNP